MTTRPKWPPRTALFTLILIGAGLRLWGIADSFYGDESFSLLRDSQRLLTESEDRFRPLFFTLLFLWKKLGFQGEVGLRLLPFAFGVLQIPAAFWLGSQLGGTRLARSFALLIAFSPLLIEFSQELRMYSLVAWLALVEAALVLALERATREGRPTRGLWVLLGFVSVCGVYTHFHYWIFLAGISASLWRLRRGLPLRDSALALGCSALLYLPNLPNVLAFQRGSAQQPHLHATDLVSALPKLAAGFSVGFNYFSLPEQGVARAVRLADLAPNLALLALVAVPALAALARIVVLHRDREARGALALCHELLTLPVLLALALAVVTGSNFLHPKYMIFSAPFALLLVALAFESLHSPRARVLAALSGAAVFAVATLHFREPERYGRRENWRAATALLERRLGDPSALLIVLGDGYQLLGYYSPELSRRQHAVKLGEPPPSVESLAARLQAIAAGKRELYYLRYDVIQNIEDKDDEILAAARSVFTGEELTRFNPRLLLYHWVRRPEAPRAIPGAR